MLNHFQVWVACNNLQIIRFLKIRWQRVQQKSRDFKNITLTLLVPPFFVVHLFAVARFDLRSVFSSFRRGVGKGGGGGGEGGWIRGLLIHFINSVEDFS